MALLMDTMLSFAATLAMLTNIVGVVEFEARVVVGKPDLVLRACGESGDYVLARMEVLALAGDDTLPHQVGQFPSPTSRSGLPRSCFSSRTPIPGMSVEGVPPPTCRQAPSGINSATYLPIVRAMGSVSLW